VPNVIKVSVENPDELLNAGMYGAGSLVRLQTSATQAGTYADVTGTGSTPTIPLVTLITAYTGYDSAGISTSWYRTRYENAGATRLSDWSTAFQVGASTIASIYDLKQRLGYSGTDSSQDEEFGQYLSDATEWIHSYTGAIFLPDPASGTVTYLFDGFDAMWYGHYLPIRRGVRSISLLEVATITNGTFSTVSATDYFLRPNPQDLRPNEPFHEIWISDLSTSVARFFPGLANIRITGAFGWGAPPGDVRDVCLSLATRTWAARQAGQADVSGTGSSGPATVSRYVSQRDLDTLNRYRPVLVA
jgi:hypothetical protein